jgi:hypothetical protein
MTELETLSGFFHYPHEGAGDINDRGQIVGLSQTPSGDNHAVLWSR